MNKVISLPLAICFITLTVFSSIAVIYFNGKNNLRKEEGTPRSEIAKIIQRGEEKKKEEENKKNTPRQMLRYENKAYGYGFTYFDPYTVQQETENSDLVISEKNEKGAELRLAVLSRSEQMNLESALEAFIESSGWDKEGEKITDVIIDGKRGLRYQKEEDNGLTTGRIVVINGQLLFQFSWNKFDKNQLENIFQAFYFNKERNEDWKKFGQYYVDDTGVYFLEYPSIAITKLQDADPKTFTEIGTCGCVEMSCGQYMRDRDHIYAVKSLVKTEVRKFSYQGYYKGPEGVIPHGAAIAMSSEGPLFACAQTIEGLDKSTFKILQGGFSRDKNNIYYLNKIFNGVDLNSFRVLGIKTRDGLTGVFSKDKNNLYYGNLQVQGVKDLKSCELDRLEECLPKDWFKNLQPS